MKISIGEVHTSSGGTVHREVTKVTDTEVTFKTVRHSEQQWVGSVATWNKGIFERWSCGIVEVP